MSKRSQRIVNSSLLKKNKTSNSIALVKPNASHEYKFFKPRQLFKSATSGVNKNSEVILSQMIQPTQSLLAKQNVSQNNEVILSQMIQPNQSLLELLKVSEVSYIVEYFT
ncbi:uncharacterized protein LOC107882752 [Acyrthosiphon pisum]|uniref:Uncharacterized protein n=1 Tax=Acyrthosiphon pisum TaxID=7029 RepID=A0A8R2D229_ACYPI|nr:uncharacterized protein LOC107882752 [Acyrthosiphon pisum]|eukprot:XP_016657080.1 PREDICTED: uncharacterized protein LOC107882752 [Acyrthosiphon pisum]